MLNRKSINFLVLLFLFFSWGVVTCLNDLLTPILKELFTLNQTQANFVSLAFFTAYFLGSLLYVVSSMLGITFFVKLGYKGLIILGLVLSGLGCLIFIPAAMYKSYHIFLIGLFSIGFGFTFMQISANPLVLLSGDAETGASRLNIAGGLNSLGTTIAPMLGVFVFYNLLDVKTNHENLKYPYILLSALFFAILFFIWKFLKTNETHQVTENITRPYALNHANLLFGMLAIFFYVGSEVTVGTNLIAYLKSESTVNLPDMLAAGLVAFYWGGAMIGRFMGGFAMGSGTVIKKLFFMIISAMLLTVLISFSAKISMAQLVYFIIYQIIAIVLFMTAKNNRTSLGLFCIVNIINLIIGSTVMNSWFAVWAIISVGMFNSIMWPVIFDLAIDGLGDLKEQGASFLIMMILGGAILPVLQGYIADTTNIVISFLVPVFGYVYILCYSLFYSKKQFNIIK